MIAYPVLFQLFAVVTDEAPTRTRSGLTNGDRRVTPCADDKDFPLVDELEDLLLLRELFFCRER